MVHGVGLSFWGATAHGLEMGRRTPVRLRGGLQSPDTASVGSWKVSAGDQGEVALQTLLDSLGIASRNGKEGLTSSTILLQTGKRRLPDRGFGLSSFE